MTPFDFLNEINQGKKDLMADDIDQQVEKQYNPFIINRGLSYFKDTALFANEMNIKNNLPPRMQYDFYRNIVTPKKRFAKWTKKEMIKVEQCYMHQIQMRSRKEQ